tara:strand:- start:412 stop:3000 length:2589 start_codon:yes stop_codon:yes gene_type:complete
MLEESLLKTNFIGRDGFRWWIGQIAPEIAQGKQINGGGWGNRFRVRILGYHPYSVIDLPDDQLPWAQALLGCTDGSGAANRATSVKISPGDSVFGFFLDGDNAQQPVIIGVFGRTNMVPSTDYKGPFQPFTGFTGAIGNDGASIPKNESNESNTTSQKHVRSVDTATAKKLNASNGTGGDPANPNAEISASKAIGKKVTAADSGKESAVKTVKNDVSNFIKKIQDITDGVTGLMGNIDQALGNVKQDLYREISSMTSSIQRGAARMVQDMTKNLGDAMVPVLNQGLQVLYDGVYATVFAATKSDPAATKAGTIAQALLIGPVKKLSDAIPCIANNVINGLSGMIEGVLKNVVDNVTNFASCIADQVVGSLINHIIGGVTKFIQPLLGGLDKILMGFSPLNFLKNTADAILGIADSLSCNAVSPEFNLASNEWVIGKGSSDKVGRPVSDILETANQALSVGTAALDTIQEIAGAADSALGVFDFMNPSVSVPGFESVLGNCYTGPPVLGGCGGTKIKIFGGNGEGGVANAIFGGIKALANADRGLTGSLLGVDLVNGGGGYTFPPFVEIVDECDRGYGASARAIIDYDPESPTFQEIVDIYVVTEGENYTIGGEVEDYIPDDEKGPIVVRSGSGYNPDDVVRDSEGNEYSIQVDTSGRVYNVIRTSSDVEEVEGTTGVLTYKSVTNTVEYNAISATGAGLRLRPRLIKRPTEFQGEVKQVIDCISKEDDLIGYVNGEPYYGPFHFHPSRGVKMVGAKHVPYPHQIIYDTKAESLGSLSSNVTTTTQIQTQTSVTTVEVEEAPVVEPTPAPTPIRNIQSSTSGSGGGGGSSSSPTPSPTPPPSPPPSPPTPPPNQGGGGYGGGY